MNRPFTLKEFDESLPSHAPLGVPGYVPNFDDSDIVVAERYSAWKEWKRTMEKAD